MVLEEALCCHGEEFHLVASAVLLQHADFMALARPDKPQVLGLGHAIPILLLAFAQRWGTLQLAIEPVQVVSEFVQDDVIAASIAPTARPNSVPGERNRATPQCAAAHQGILDCGAPAPPERPRVHKAVRVNGD